MNQQTSTLDRYFAVRLTRSEYDAFAALVPAGQRSAIARRGIQLALAELCLPSAAQEERS